MKIEDIVGVIINAGGGVGRALALELARREVHGLALVDASQAVMEVGEAANVLAGDRICLSFQGVLDDETLRRSVYLEAAQSCGKVNLCVPVCEAPRTEWELIHAVFWAMEMVATIAQGRAQRPPGPETASHATPALVVFVGRGSAFRGMWLNPRATAKSELRRATARLLATAWRNGVGCKVLPSEARVGHHRVNGGPAHGNGSHGSHRAGKQPDAEAVAREICRVITAGNRP